MKKVIKLSESDLTKIVKKVIKENMNTTTIAEKHIEPFVNKTINDFSDVISNMEQDLNKNEIFIYESGSIVADLMEDLLKLSQRLVNRVNNLEQKYVQLNKK